MYNKIMDGSNSTLNTAGEVLDTTGKAKAICCLVTAVILSLLLFASADYYTFDSDDKDYAKVTGTVNNPKCTKLTSYDQNGNEQISYKCVSDIKYSYNNESYSQVKSLTENSPLTNGESVSVFVNKENPKDIVINRTSDSTIAIIVCVIGILLLVIAGGN